MTSGKLRRSMTNKRPATNSILSDLRRKHKYIYIGTRAALVEGGDGEQGVFR